MNLYQLKDITNRLDRRLIDLFVKQNQNNEWLTVVDCAAWVFETNNPSEYHRTYTRNKLTALVGWEGTRQRELSAFENNYECRGGGSFTYRLKVDDLIKQHKAQTIGEQIEASFNHEAEYASSSTLVDELDF